MLRPKIDDMHFVKLLDNKRFYVYRYFPLAAKYLYTTDLLRDRIAKELDREVPAIERLLARIGRVEPIGFDEARAVVCSLDAAIEVASGEKLQLEPRSEIVGAFFTYSNLDVLAGESIGQDWRSAVTKSTDFSVDLIESMAEGFRVTLETALTLHRLINAARLEKGLEFSDPQASITSDPGTGKRGAAKHCLLRAPRYKSWPPEEGLLAEDSAKAFDSCEVEK